MDVFSEIKGDFKEIPSGFVTEFGNSLSNPIILEVPTGKKWEVEMSKVGGEDQVWLGNGWLGFSEHYSLQKGHLLVFEYQGNSHFNVLIFDMTATEIDYPGSCSRDGKSKPKMNKNKEFIDLISDQHHIQQFGGNVASCSQVNTSASNFTSSNPWFKVVLNSIGNLSVPFSFMEKHMKCETKTVILKVEDKSWPVKLNVYLSSRVAGLYAGVASFWKDNSLKQGDVCVFELIRNDIFTVSIFRI
ncbi:B3 domain-containing transcription factor VRN1-like isoform X2 [Euphorbia lathyris]|uniref:B3 domain-containing transcription factor VRN1-like isoform X2 n=1 Tax=Euphorbia lathyris TaxID=212925 RepID=UPI0033143511